MQPHQERVVIEHKDLSEKLAELDAFCEGDAFKKLDATDRKLLLEQGLAMSDYLRILDHRINRFSTDKQY
jgi:hypothetical protein